MTSDVPRIAPQMNLPASTYIPGRTPRPSNAAETLAYDLHAPSLHQPLVWWRESVAYCHAIDLFNHGYYWEAHEVWEGLWIGQGRRGPLADCLKGLIKLAAAGVKTRAGSEHGRRHHARRAAELFAQASDLSTPPAESIQRACGLSPQRLSSWAREAAEQNVADVSSDSDAPAIVFSFVLRPADH